MRCAIVCDRFVLRVRGRMDTYQGQSRLKQNLLRATPINYAEEGKLLAKYVRVMASLTEVRAPAPPPRCACMPAIVYACLRRVG